MTFSMTGQDKCDLLIQVTAYIEVTAWPIFYSYVENILRFVCLFEFYLIAMPYKRI